MDFARCTHDTLTPNRPPARGGPTIHVCRTELNGQATQATRKRWPYYTRLPLQGYITCSKPAYFCLLSLFYLLAALSPQYQDVSSRLKVPQIVLLCCGVLDCMNINNQDRSSLQDQTPHCRS